MNKLKKLTIGYGLDLKVANMRKPQEFLLYPYKGGDEIILQSNKRIIRLNLRTGKAVINQKNRENCGFPDLVMNPFTFEFPKNELTEIKKHLWENEGKEF